MSYIKRSSHIRHLKEVLKCLCEDLLSVSVFPQNRVKLLMYYYFKLFIMQEKNPEQNQNINIKINDETLKGVYSNTMQVLHTKEEFVMDFMDVFPPNGIVAARVITSPGHMKRIARALQENITKYEAKFGAIEESKAPPVQFREE